MLKLDWHAQPLLVLLLLQVWLAATADVWRSDFLMAREALRESVVASVGVASEVQCSSCASFSLLLVGREIGNFASVRMASCMLLMEQAVRCLGRQLVSIESRWDVLFVRGGLEID